jgi:hypothetical protein
MTKYIIQDWTGARKFSGHTFASFEDGWAHIYEHVDNSLFELSGDDNDNEYQEFFVVRADPEGRMADNELQEARSLAERVSQLIRRDFCHVSEELTSGLLSAALELHRRASEELISRDEIDIHSNN